MSILYLDIETYSEVPIKYGVHAYAEGAEIMLLAWALDDNPAQVWDVTLGTAMPEELARAVVDPKVLFCAHNSFFDRTLLTQSFPGYGFGRLDRWRDTMVQAVLHSLPGGLADLCDILGLEADKAKDKAGKALVQLFCKPRPKNSQMRRATRETHPTEWARFMEYARLDVEAMREVFKRLPSWNCKPAEIALWHLDQKINDRGFAVDVDLVQSALEAVALAQGSLAERAAELSNGAVQAATQRGAMLAHILADYGVDLPDLQASTIERRMEDPDLPLALRQLLGVRLQASSTSTAKYRALANSVSGDGRLRGSLQFCGAGRTGRWSGRLFQPQNLPRPEYDDATIEVGIEAIKLGGADLLFDDVMGLASSAVRGCIIAPTGRKLVVSDLSNIEGRGQAWIAGERWKLEAFEAFDDGAGPDLYKLAYAKSFGTRPESVTKDQRQVGKVMELALGYEGGVGAFVTFAAAYSIDLEELSLRAWEQIDPAILSEAKSALTWARQNNRPTYGLSDRAWIVCDAFKRAWRYAHPKISSLWKDLDSAIRRALSAPGVTHLCGMLKVRVDGGWLRIALPSGRALCYPSPRIQDSKITYMGFDRYSRKWSRISSYGGMFFENICQGLARDVMAANMPTIETSGFPIVLTVHDEVLTEPLDLAEYSADKLSGLLAAQPVWAPGMPLAASGFETYRYRKD